MIKNKLQKQVRKNTRSNTRGMPKVSKKRKVTNQKGAYGRKGVASHDYYTGPAIIKMQWLEKFGRE